MKYLYLIIIALMIAGCSTTRQQEIQDYYRLHKHFETRWPYMNQAEREYAVKSLEGHRERIYSKNKRRGRSAFQSSIMGSVAHGALSGTIPPPPRAGYTNCYRVGNNVNCVNY